MKTERGWAVCIWPEDKYSPAIRAALDENAALRKALDELGAPTEPDAMCAELVKCGTFTAEAQTASDTIRIGKDLYDALRRDRERLDKLERLHTQRSQSQKLGWDD